MTKYSPALEDKICATQLLGGILQRNPEFEMQISPDGRVCSLGLNGRWLDMLAQETFHRGGLEQHENAIIGALRCA